METTHANPHSPKISSVIVETGTTKSPASITRNEEQLMPRAPRSPRPLHPVGLCLATFFLCTTAAFAQTHPPAPPQPQTPASPQEHPLTVVTPPQNPLSDAMKDPALVAEFGILFNKLHDQLQSPAPRTESHLIAVLPESTNAYAALPNYGATVRQTLAIFRQELQQSDALRKWWTSGDLAIAGPKAEDALDKFSQLCDFLGDEAVLSGRIDVQHVEETHFLFIAEIRKPGLDTFLRQSLAALSGSAKPWARIFTPAELSDANEGPKVPASEKQLLILVRPDYVAAALDLATLRALNDRVKSPNRSFGSSPFGQRIAKAYTGGATMVSAVDLHTLLAQAATLGTASNKQSFERSGFADLQYAVWRHATEAGRPVSEGELDFSAPRTSIAAWLAKPAPLGSLDFVSPKSIFAFSIRLANLSQIFDDVQALAPPENAKTFGAVTGGAKALNLNVKDDLLNLLGPELTVVLDDYSANNAAWKIIWQVQDAQHLQKTLATLFALAHLQPTQGETAGVAYSSVRIPSQKPTDIAYTFSDGYLLVAPKPELLADAVHLHGSPDSLAKSKPYLASLAPGESADASAIFYEDALSLMSKQMRLFAPEYATLLNPPSRDPVPAVMRVYAEPSTIREVNTTASLDLSSSLMIAAIAIPNLLRSKIAANEATAVGSVRTINTAQITYAASYPDRGFARDLASLGSTSPTAHEPSPQHAGLLDQTLGNSTCTVGKWCVKSGYQFQIAAVCLSQMCVDYRSLATPVDANTGSRSFCSTSDGVIHAKTGPPVTTVPTVKECHSWPPLR
jgi:hypothetical protein